MSFCLLFEQMQHGNRFNVWRCTIPHRLGKLVMDSLRRVVWIPPNIGVGVGAMLAFWLWGVTLVNPTPTFTGPCPAAGFIYAHVTCNNKKDDWIWRHELQALTNLHWWELKCALSFQVSIQLSISLDCHFLVSNLCLCVASNLLPQKVNFEECPCPGGNTTILMPLWEHFVYGQRIEFHVQVSFRFGMSLAERWGVHWKETQAETKRLTILWWVF